MMDNILLLRENAVDIYKNYETAIRLFAKFLMGLILFTVIGNIDYLSPGFAFIGKPQFSLPINLALSFLFTFLPATLAFLTVIADIAARLSAAPEICVIVTLLMLCVELFYVRMAPRESFLIIVTVLLFYFKLPYIAPLMAGLYFGMTSAVPVALGVCIWSFAGVVKNAVEATASSGFDITQLPAAFGAAYAAILSGFTANFSWAVTAFIFCVVILAVNMISRLSVNHSKDFALALGCVLCVVSFLVVILIVSADIGIPGMLISTVISGLIVRAVMFFDCVLDYRQVERVQLEDNDNYYYVKIVPKIVPHRRTGALKRITRG